MKFLGARALVATLILSAGFAAFGYAGQVRISATSGNAFSPANVTINHGDHVVWVWTGGNHSVTSGTDGSTTGDGTFNSGVQLFSQSPTFSWKSGQQVDAPFYCIPHFSINNMVGNISFSLNAPVSDFRITEVQFNAGAGLNRIEIANLGAALGNLGRYRISVSNGVAVTLKDGIVVSGNGGRVVLHVAAAGTDDATNLYLPSMTELGTNGSVALYVPNTITGLNLLTNPNMIIDYMQWGASAQPNEATAAAATFWSTGDAITGVGPGHSVERCSTSYGIGAWAEIAVPNFGANGNCSTPTRTSTWGRIKSLYR
jgi:plastocyanin